MKKAGIVTYWNTKDNYGTVLQNYALQCFLKSNSIDAELIRVSLNHNKTFKDTVSNYRKQHGILRTLCLLASQPLRKILKVSFNKNQNKRSFELFRRQYLKMTQDYSSYTDLKENCVDDYDYLIAGSDQIWNMYDYKLNQAYDLIHTYYLDFGRGDVKRLSCAASFGKNSISEDLIEEIQPLLNKFEFVSVREEFGIELCEKLDNHIAVRQYDPTLLLSVDEYKKLTSGIDTNHKRPYVLLYLLSNSCDFDIHGLYAWAECRNIEVVYVAGNETLRSTNKYSKTYPTIQEWISLIENAEYIFTNSFHGSIFCILFNKKFMAISQTGKFASQNGRITSLLNDFGLIERLYSKNFGAVCEEINYDRVNKTLESIRNSSPFVEYIKKECNK